METWTDHTGDFRYYRWERGDTAPCCGCEIVFGGYPPHEDVCPCQCHQGARIVWGIA